MATLRGSAPCSPVLAAVARAVTLVALAAGLARAAGEVTLETAGPTLAELLPRLGQQAGEKLRAGAGLGERRLFFFARQRDFEETRAVLARFLATPPGRCLWTRDRDTRVLEEDRTSRDTRRRRAAERQRRARRYREQALQRVIALAGMSREQLMRAGPEGQRLAMLQRQRGLREWLAIFQGLPSAYREAALNGRSFSLGYHGFPPAGREAVRVIASRHNPGTQRPDGTVVNQFIGQRDYPNTIMHVSALDTPEGAILMMRLEFPPSRGGVVVGDLLTVPDESPAGHARLEASLAEWESRRLGPLQAEDDPRLQRAVTPRGGTVEEVLAGLAAQAGLPLIGEYDPCFVFAESRQDQLRVTLGAGEVTRLPLWQALEKVTHRFDLRWELDGDWLCLRSPRTERALTGELDLSPPGARDERVR